MTSTSTVSIIIVNWNGLKWLKKLLDSVCNQTYKNYEVIFVDNLSSDKSVEYVKANYPNVRIIQNDRNAGFAGGNNLGISHAKGKLIMLLNTDTWLEKGFLQKLVDEKIQKKLDVIAPQEADYYTKQHRVPYITRIDSFGHPIFITKSVNRAKSFYLSGVCLLFSKEIYEETGGLDSSFFMYCEEVDWFWRLLLLRCAFDYAENIYVYHVGGGSSAKGMNDKVFRWRNENTLRMLLKNYKSVSLMIVLPIYFLIGFFEIIFFCIILKPKFAKTYIEGWNKTFNDRQEILVNRKYIQHIRQIGDFQILKIMYIGTAKIHHLRSYIKRKRNLFAY